MASLVTTIVLVALVVLGLAGGAAHARSQPDGQLTIAFDAAMVLRENTNSARVRLALPLRQDPARAALRWREGLRHTTHRD